jgi:hypothetical protein
VKGEHTEICRCTVLQLAAIDRAIKSERQYDVLLGRAPWTRRDRALLERLRDVRGLNVIEDHQGSGLYVTIAGSLNRDGFTVTV